MRLYLIENDRAARYVGTKDEAKRDARACGGKWSAVDVPTDKDGLRQFLNRSLALPVSAPEPVGATVDRAHVPTPAAVPVDEKPLSLTQVEEFIQAAEHHQLARVFDNALYRLRELRP